jgi:hypothetical protein
MNISDFFKHTFHLFEKFSNEHFDSEDITHGVTTDGDKTDMLLYIITLKEYNDHSLVVFLSTSEANADGINKIVFRDNSKECSYIYEPLSPSITVHRYDITPGDTITLTSEIDLMISWITEFRHSGYCEN